MVLQPFSKVDCYEAENRLSAPENETFFESKLGRLADDWVPQRAQDPIQGAARSGHQQTCLGANFFTFPPTYTTIRQKSHIGFSTNKKRTEGVIIKSYLLRCDQVKT